MSIHLKWTNVHARTKHTLDVHSTSRGLSAEFLTFPIDAETGEPPSRLEAGSLTALASSIRDTVSSQEFADLLAEVWPGDMQVMLIDVLDVVFPAEEFA